MTEIGELVKFLKTKVMRESTFKLIEISIEELSEIIRTAVAKELHKQNPVNQVADINVLMTRQDVKDFLRVSYTTLFHWNNNNILKVHVKRGRKVFYLKSDVIGLDDSNLDKDVA
ncbi:MAG: hypothetical protein EOO50_08695 [Flavobacterium sp.]|uniref:hypothetical protein n=1 Tax=Flavobacterium sp. TaxID=239 RepID=UPI0011FE653A|nr:hypothetical protein [Flavobacterium sp.]RZJ66761.1 MAG: hypothetical protein EOO50_08695 [Flavobacterium sp.]